MGITTAAPGEETPKWCVCISLLEAFKNPPTLLFPCFTENPPYSLGLWATKSSVTGGVGQGQSLLIGNMMSVPCQPVLLVFPHQNYKKPFQLPPAFTFFPFFFFFIFFFCQRELYPLKAAEFTSPWKAKLAFAALQLANCLGEQAVNSALELSCCLPNNEQM